MIIVVTEVKKKGNLPQWAIPLWTMLNNVIGYAFENETIMERFVKSYQKSNLFLFYKRKIELTHDDKGGTIDFMRYSSYDGSSSTFLTVRYLVLHGHIHVTRDGLTLHTQDFFKEDM